MKRPSEQSFSPNPKRLKYIRNINVDEIENCNWSESENEETLVKIKLKKEDGNVYTYQIDFNLFSWNNNIGNLYYLLQHGEKCINLTDFPTQTSVYLKELWMTTEK